MKEGGGFQTSHCSPRREVSSVPFIFNIAIILTLLLVLVAHECKCETWREGKTLFHWGDTIRFRFDDDRLYALCNDCDAFSFREVGFAEPVRIFAPVDVSFGTSIFHDSAFLAGSGELWCTSTRFMGVVNIDAEGFGFISLSDCVFFEALHVFAPTGSPRLSMTGTVFHDEVDVLLPFCDTVDLRGLRPRGNNAVLTLHTLGIDAHGVAPKLALDGNSVHTIDFQASQYDFWFPGTESSIYIPGDSVSEKLFIANKSRTLLAVRNRMQELGYTDSYEHVDKLYRKHAELDNGDWPDRVKYYANLWWWDFGYGKERIFIIAGAFWLVATAFNLFWYKELSTAVYQIPFLDAGEGYVSSWIRRVFRYVLKVCTYTGYVFFTLKLDPEKFQPGALRNHPLLFTWLMFTYLIGLVCLGFIANLVFSLA